MEKISIIIPAYNTEKYIAECLDSIENQTYKNIEIVVIDDGSTDNTYSIVETYSKNYQNIILYRQKNAGVCAARNKGLDLATGDYIMFVDSDDFIVSDAIESMYTDILENNADIAVGKTVGDKTDMSIDTSKLELIVWRGREALFKNLEDHPSLYGCWNKLYKKSAIGNIRFEVGRKIHEDGFFLFLLLINLPTVAVRDKATYIYRSNPSSASHAKFSDKFFDVLYFEEKKREIILENFPEYIDLAYNCLVKAHLTMLHCFCTTKDKKYNKDIKNSIKTVRKYSKYFIPAIPGDKKFFLIVKFGLFWLFRRLYWKKYPLNK